MTTINCVYCEKPMDTKKETVLVTVKWLYNELLKLNDIKANKNPPRVIGICTHCWESIFKKKLNLKDWYWTYNREI